MIVTQIRESASKPGFLRVSVDNEDVGMVTLEDVRELGLVAGCDIDETKFDILIEKVKNLGYYFQALHYADRRLRSKNEVRSYLTRKGCDSEVAISIVSKLVKAGLIDEVRLTEAFVHDSTLTKPLSTRAIKMKLRQKGLSDQSINDGLESADLDDSKALDDLIERKARQSAYANNQPRFFRYLLSQGFGFEEIAARIGKPERSGGGGRSGNRSRID